MEDITAWWRYGVVATFTVIWWLIRQKDAARSQEIAEMEARRKADSELLWKKHDDDVSRLAELELSIARKHYVKEELDNRFDRLESSISNGMLSLGSKIDKLSEALLKHMLEEPR